MAEKSDFGRELESQTDAYLERLDDCLGLLPQLLEEYENGEDYAATVERIGDLESEGDTMIRSIISSITNSDPEDMGLLNTRINYNQSGLIEFYKQVDSLANVTERIADEIAMMQPPTDTECYQGLREMAEHVADMTETLEEVVERFVHGLGTTSGSDTLYGEIKAIRDMESRCDSIKNDVIRTAFADEETAEALMYRELAILFDDLANTMEDVTDQIIVIASDEPGLVTEVDPSEE
ncbi:Protein of unknown function DUF47 [Halorhabdus tiamatea SARL4B]|uniref:DUF47 family protein n=1 Tax=Halorhabdus tiamatea SARL4B TaxID=1033806 RepID=F7PKK1_9EURY|nr:DUF47 family protein [Halorhabdus tiamatea]ERJ05982.1 Protein of unknown function DUF47 [Halorhabdus tiamatea SARL4B]CCQ33986.1 conserved hypothetical protein (DUF47) [Halorhabdus tiamatea SARL4B]